MIGQHSWRQAYRRAPLQSIVTDSRLKACGPTVVGPQTQYIARRRRGTFILAHDDRAWDPTPIYADPSSRSSPSFAASRFRNARYFASSIVPALSPLEAPAS